MAERPFSDFRLILITKFTLNQKIEMHLDNVSISYRFNLVSCDVAKILKLSNSIDAYCNW